MVVFYSAGSKKFAQRTSIRKDPRLGKTIFEKTNHRSSHIVNIEAIQFIEDGKWFIKPEYQNETQTLRDYLISNTSLQMSTVCQLINDIIQGLKDMASLRLIYDISADIKQQYVGYLGARYGVFLRVKYDLKPLYYLIAEMIRKTRSDWEKDLSLTADDVVISCTFTYESKNTINQMLNNQITIENIPTISCQSQNQNTTSNEKREVYR